MHQGEKNITALSLGFFSAPAHQVLAFGSSAWVPVILHSGFVLASAVFPVRAGRPVSWPTRCAPAPAGWYSIAFDQDPAGASAPRDRMDRTADRKPGRSHRQAPAVAYAGLY